MRAHPCPPEVVRHRPVERASSKERRGPGTAHMSPLWRPSQIADLSEKAAPAAVPWMFDTRNQPPIHHIFR